ncbi:hypothetical protein AWC32_06085 [Mycobacterium xenopi]|nr:hypothetical protein AWC32_06085 [Mycobacterium xenopi]
MLAAAIGYGLARANHVLSGPPASTSATASTGEERFDHQIDQASLSSAHKAFHVAVLHRSRPSAWSPPVVSSGWSLSQGFLPASRHRLGVGALHPPVTSLAGRERLTQFCVARH